MFLCDLLPCHYLCLVCVYVIHELDLHEPVLACACMSVCACRSLQEKVIRFWSTFPRFAYHFHGLTTQFDIFLTIECDPRVIVSAVFMLSYFV